MQGNKVETLKRFVVGQVQAALPQAIELSDWLHAHPEASFQEFEATKHLTALLAQDGFAIEQDIAGMETAFRAQFSLDANGPNIAYLAEYDALPELGHACGHNLIAAASWIAASAVKRTLEEYQIPGTITLLGTPGQELYSGKAMMVKEGCFTSIDAALMVHPNDRNILDPASMALDEFEASFHGTSAHAAEAPHEGRNALNAVLLLFRSIDALRQHIEPDARIHGIITDGGKMAGLVPDFAQARFACRAVDRATLDVITRRLQNCAEGAAMATETRLDFRTFEPRVDIILHDPDLSALFRANWEQFVDDIALGKDCLPMGALDTGNVSQVVPTIQPMVAAVPEGIKHHTREFADAMNDELAHEALAISAQTLAMTGIDVLLRS